MQVKHVRQRSDVSNPSVEVHSPNTSDVGPDLGAAAAHSDQSSSSPQAGEWTLPTITSPFSANVPVFEREIALAWLLITNTEPNGED